jgi:hypothetical protein
MDVYEQFLGPDHVLTSELRLEGLIRFFGRNRLSLAETQVRDFLCKPQRASDYDPFVYFLAQYHLAWVLQQQGKLEEYGEEAERLAQESASWCYGEGKFGFLANFQLCSGRAVCFSCLSSKSFEVIFCWRSRSCGIGVRGVWWTLGPKTW